MQYKVFRTADAQLTCDTMVCREQYLRHKKIKVVAVNPGPVRGPRHLLHV